MRGNRRNLDPLTANLIISFVLKKELNLSFVDLDRLSEKEVAAYLILLDEYKRMQEAATSK